MVNKNNFIVLFFAITVVRIIVYKVIQYLITYSVSLLIILQIIYPVNGILLSVFHQLATSVTGSVNNVLDGVLGTLNNVIDTLSPSTSSSLSTVDNAASRLIHSVSRSSPGILRAVAKELNSTTPEIESYRQNTIDTLKVTATTPPVLRNLLALLQHYVEILPRSTLSSSGVFVTIPQMQSALVNELASEFNDMQLHPLITDVETMTRLMIANLGYLTGLRQLPNSLLYLHDHVLATRDNSVLHARLLNQSSQTQSGALNELISACDGIANSVPIILQTVQNAISGTRLNLELIASEVDTDIQQMIRQTLHGLSDILNSTLKPLLNLNPSKFQQEIQTSLEYNRVAIRQSVELAQNLTEIGNEDIDLLVGRIKSGLYYLENGVEPTVTILTTQLGALRNTFETAILNYIPPSSNLLFTVFDGSISSLQANLIVGHDLEKICVNMTIPEIEDIVLNSVRSLGNCASMNAKSSIEFINNSLDDADEILLTISHLADQLDACSALINTSSSNIIISCLQTCYMDTQRNAVLALDQLSKIQETTANKINSVHDTIHSCTNQAIYDSENAAVILEKSVERCLRANK